MGRTTNSEGNNQTSVTTQIGGGKQVERKFSTREDRQLYIRTRHSEYPPSISRQTRTVERTGYTDND